jgi:hypothetical protein
MQGGRVRSWLRVFGRAVQEPPSHTQMWVTCAVGYLGCAIAFALVGGWTRQGAFRLRLDRCAVHWDWDRAELPPARPKVRASLVTCYLLQPLSL